MTINFWMVVNLQSLAFLQTDSCQVKQAFMETDRPQQGPEQREAYPQPASPPQCSPPPALHPPSWWSWHWGNSTVKRENYKSHLGADSFTLAHWPYSLMVLCDQNEGGSLTGVMMEATPTGCLSNRILRSLAGGATISPYTRLASSENHSRKEAEYVISPIDSFMGFPCTYIWVITNCDIWSLVNRNIRCCILYVMGQNTYTLCCDQLSKIFLVLIDQIKPFS